MSKSLTVRTSDLADVPTGIVARIALPEVTPEQAREGYQDLQSFTSDRDALINAHRMRETVEKGIMLREALVLYRATVSGHVFTGKGKDAPEGAESQKDYAESIGKGESYVSRLVKIGALVAEWEVTPGSDDYTVAVRCINGQGSKDKSGTSRGDQGPNILKALKGDPRTEEGRAALRSALDAWHAGPPVAVTATEEGEPEEGKTEGSGDTRAPQVPDGTDVPEGTAERVHQKVRTVEDALIIIGGLQDVLETFTADDQDVVFEAWETMVRDLRKSRTVKGEVVEKS